MKITHDTVHCNCDTCIKTRKNYTTTHIYGQYVRITAEDIRKDDERHELLKPIIC